MVTRDDRYTDSVTPEGVLIGMVHHCPICFSLLRFNDFPAGDETYWHCPNCGWWDTQELIHYMMKDEGG